MNESGYDQVVALLSQPPYLDWLIENWQWKRGRAVARIVRDARSKVPEAANGGTSPS